MTVGIWILGHQLSLNHPALQRFDALDGSERPPILLIESLRLAGDRPYHRQKLVLVWSAMRHFAAELSEAGWDVTYCTEETFATPLTEWIEDQRLSEVWLMDPEDFPFKHHLETLDLPCPLKFLDNNLFLWSQAEFFDWATSRKSLLLESFYREGRKRFQVLMKGHDPKGGIWNYDKQNRQPPRGDLNPPKPLSFPPDEVTQAVMEQVNQVSQSSGYGEMEGFAWAVTRSQALEVLDYFLEHQLPQFGPYQDAMVTREETLWHSLLSPYLNLGLLHPREVIAAVETAYDRDQFPIASVEGFIRQVLGWREYMRGLYLYFGPEYAHSNWFDHDAPLPEFFWDAEKTDLNCLYQVLKQVERSGYAHHIQRLMILGNFATIAGLSPQAVVAWFHAAFIDGYDWVMQTNVLGMALFADGGRLATKPYVASANYIHKMSDYCQHCRYDRRSRTGDRACPVNVFYWDFLIRHRDRLKDLGRMNLMLSHIKRISPEEQAQIQGLAEEWRAAQGR
ncbi:deoxyribodipyrimidine photolyase [Phormidium willei BDU 130791]|nr:deoxyribodipyrimidine photolyase [Phormidium willei BDU 130791]